MSGRISVAGENLSSVAKKRFLKLNTLASPARQIPIVEGYELSVWELACGSFGQMISSRAPSSTSLKLSM